MEEAARARLEIVAAPPTHVVVPASDKLHDRFRSFVRGGWLMLLEVSGRGDEQAAIARRRGRHQDDDVQTWLLKSCHLPNRL